MITTIRTSTALAPTLDAIRDHYNRLSPFYRAFWGDHIHHGYWEGGEPLTPAAAQEQLVRRLAERAEIPHGARVLDVGCGLGGSAFWLARELGCTVDGITLSPVQAAMAAERARERGLEDRVRFRVHDAHELDRLGERYHAVWSVECAEHLSDRMGFLAGAARRLEPGGVFALCTWLRGARAHGRGDELHRRICEGMLCPPLASLEELVQGLRATGFEDIDAEDITPRVSVTWRWCTAIVQRPEVCALLALSNDRTRRFVATFPAMQEGYAARVLGYGMFVARRPASADHSVNGVSEL